MNDLWSDVVRSPTERLGHGPVTDVLLAHPKVGYLDVAVLVEHDVVQLEVPVDHTQGVEEDVPSPPSPSCTKYQVKSPDLQDTPAGSRIPEAKPGWLGSFLSCSHQSG